MTEQEKSNILAWMDKQIELDKMIREVEDYSDEIKACTGLHNALQVQIFEGIGKLAMAADEELSWRSNKGEFGGEHYFLYKDYTFFQLGKGLG